MKENISIEESENQASDTLAPELKIHLDLAQSFMNLLGDVLLSMGTQSLARCLQSSKVCSLLLVRLANDLRCVMLLARRGYPLQALAICSSIYEVGIAISNIAGDEQLAQKWIDHDKPDVSFFNLKNATVTAYKKLGVPEPEKQAQADYRVYSQFCMGKHANPLLQASHGLILEDQNARLQNGPDTSEVAIRALWFAMQQSVRYIYLAICAFVTEHVPRETQSVIAERANQLGAIRADLQQKAIKRWGQEDPFEGKWRCRN